MARKQTAFTTAAENAEGGKIAAPTWRRWLYSILRAFMGWMLAARLAGMTAAKNEQKARETAATDSANGSHELIP